MLLVQAGSGVATMGLPDSPGVPAEATSNTLIANYNDSEAVEELFRIYPDDIAAIIIEPAAANMGLVLPCPAFLGRSGLQAQPRGKVPLVSEPNLA